MLTFRTFGPIDIRREDGERLDALLSQPKRLALLAYLAERQPSGPVRREQVLSLLWPESAPSDGRHALSATLSRLRKSLGEEVLRGRGEETIALSPDHIRADVTAFQEHREAGRPREALEVYRGPFLEGFRLADARGFEEWVEGRRQAYRRLAYEAGLEAAERAREANAGASARQLLERTVEIRPLKEEAVARLLRLLAEQGDRTEALQRYDRFRGRLDEELELSPSEDLRALARRLRSEPSPSGQVAEGEAGDGAEEAITAGEAPDEDAHSRPRPAAAGPPLHLLAGVLLVALALAAGGIWAWGALAPSTDGERVPFPESESDATPTVAVLPFEEVGGTGEMSPLVQGLRSDLFSRLTRLPGLRVISETSADRFQDATLALPAIADSLEARWVLEGAVQQVGDTVQVHAQLIDSETDTHVWAETFQRDRSAGHLFGLQRELARRIIEAVAPELGTETSRDLTARPTVSSEAYELYLEARGLSYTEGAAEAERNRSIRLYQRALQLDSTFAEAWAGLADAYADRVWGSGDPRSWADSGITAAREAIRHDPDLPDGYTQLGDNLGVFGRTAAQIDAYRKALRLRPSHYQTLNNLTHLLSTTGRLADAMKWLDRAYRASPESIDLLPLLVHKNALLGRENVAEAWLRYARTQGHELLEARFRLELFVHNDLPGARATLQRLREGSDEPYYQRRAALAVYEEDWEEALRLYRAFAQDHHLALGREGALSAGPGWAVALDRLGRDEEANTVARRTLEAVSQASEGFGQAPKRRVQAAVASLVLGDTDRALTKLSEAVDLGYRNQPVMRSVPVLDPIRDRARFQALITRIDSLVAEERRQVEQEGWGMPPQRFLGEMEVTRLRGHLDTRSLPETESTLSNYWRSAYPAAFEARTVELVHAGPPCSGQPEPGFL